MCFLCDASKPLPKALVVNLLQLTHCLSAHDQRMVVVITMETPLKVHISNISLVSGSLMFHTKYLTVKPRSRSNQDRIWSKSGNKSSLN